MIVLFNKSFYHLKKNEMVFEESEITNEVVNELLYNIFNMLSSK